MNIEILKTGGTLEDCERILRNLPEWFGIEESIQNYLSGINLNETYFATDGDELVGFVSLKNHFETTVEIYVLAVHPKYHRKGIGSLLLAAVEKYLKSKSVRMITVKTLGPSHNDVGYVNTRKYYLSLGFIPLEEFAELWDINNPCLFMAKSI